MAQRTSSQMGFSSSLLPLLLTSSSSGRVSTLRSTVLGEVSLPAPCTSALPLSAHTGLGVETLTVIDAWSSCCGTFGQLSTPTSTTTVSTPVTTSLAPSAALNAVGTFGAITTVAATPVVVVTDMVVTVMLGAVVLMAMALEAVAFVVVAHAAITLATAVLTAVVLGLAVVALAVGLGLAVALAVDGLAAIAVAIVAFAAAVLAPVALADGTEVSVMLAAVTLVALVRFWRSRYSKTPKNPFSASCTFVFLRRYDVFRKYPKILVGLECLLTASLL
ncbi:hypothetical protein EDB86DRAFT_2828947 [Lactarius hatsudake]|nr:hypothetical protein EDB86DRAFT_2828947 [Lactarius hatsudake]